MKLPWAEDAELGAQGDAEHPLHQLCSHCHPWCHPLTPDPVPQVPFPAFPKNNRQKKHPNLVSQEEIQPATATGKQ